MATETRYWNGAWRDSSVYWTSESPTSDGIRYTYNVQIRAQVIDYTSATLAIQAVSKVEQTQGLYWTVSKNGSKTVRTGTSIGSGTVIGTDGFTWTDVSSRGWSYNFGGEVQTYGMAGSDPYNGPKSTTRGSTSLTDPFAWVVYDANGGSDAPSQQVFFKSNNSTLSLATPTRGSYSFLGWSTDPNATTATYQPGATVSFSAGYTTLYAVWKMSTKIYVGTDPFMGGYVGTSPIAEIYLGTDSIFSS